MVASIENITIGADPEFFLLDSGKPMSAHDIVPGSKLQPHKLKNGAAVQADGTAVEFNIRPAKTAEAFAKNVKSALTQVRDLVPKKYKFNFTPSVQYDTEYFSSLPQSATEIGCSPDFAATDRGRKIWKSPTMVKQYENYRMGGGHIHIGWGSGLDVQDPAHLYDCVTLCKNLYSYLAYAENLWTDDTIRKNIYGDKGAFRPKPYGVEFRALSNAWLEYPILWPWLFEVTKEIFAQTMQGKRVYGGRLARTKMVMDKSMYGYSYVDNPLEDMIKEFNNSASKYLTPVPDFSKEHNPIH